VHDFKRFSVDEDMSKTGKNIMDSVKKVGVNEIEELLDLHKEKLYN
jgi:hypothetical protein